MTTVESDYYAFREFDRAAMKDGRSHYVQFFDAGPVLELACGRGEFLELLAEAGIEGRGVDLDPGMVQICRAGGQEVDLGDALEALAAQPDASVRGLFCAHFLEHLPSERAEQVYRDAARVLEPGGTFVAVVPNMGSLSVLSYDFWRDPTHVRPYDPMVLAFFADQAGLQVAESGCNPRVDPGPPPHLWPLDPDPLPTLTDELAALTNAVHVRHRRSRRHGLPLGIGRRARERDDEALELWRLLEAMIKRYDDSIQATQHHLYDLRSAYLKLLKQLYPPNEVFVVARKGSSPSPHD